ncbi:MAG: EAL domain-containing protein [Phycisphaeraceae bacterium]|nr:EAL domain-containing protein [Phycisphaeraceae bacterium]
MTEDSGENLGLFTWAELSDPVLEFVRLRAQIAKNNPQMSSQQVLLIDDAPMTHKLVGVRLQELGVEILGAMDGKSGLEAARQQKPALVLLDVNLPDMDGFEVCRVLREDPATRDMQIIFLTASDDRAQKLRAFSMGATDYITKPFDAAELRARVSGVLKSQMLLNHLGVQANTDALTGLPNRAAFRQALTERLAQADGERPAVGAVLFLDLDRFKIINDSLGHEKGDELLVAVAGRLRACLGAHGRRLYPQGPDMIARMGGDEFTILLAQMEDPREATDLADRLRVALSEPFGLQGQEVVVGVSIGVRHGQGDEATADDLLRDSDAAMYRAKAEGKGKWVVFDEGMYEEAMARLQLENDLHRAIEERQFLLHYQPIICLETGHIRGFEALLRWKHPTRGMVPPGSFIPLCEEIGLIGEIGQWVLREACGQLRAWQSILPRGRELTISVNLSKKQLVHPELVDQVRAILADTKVDPGHVVLEVTESDIMCDPRATVRVLGRLHDLKLKLAMDDFGTGYSSLASLHRFPIDILKIDRQFILSLTESRSFSAIVQAIITLAHNLKMQVVAEGIETSEQLAQLQALECNSAQGYFFAAPLAAPAAAEMLQQIYALPRVA